MEVSRLAETMTLLEAVAVVEVVVLLVAVTVAQVEMLHFKAEVGAIIQVVTAERVAEILVAEQEVLVTEE
jgi:hypothetical protein